MVNLSLSGKEIKNGDDVRTQTARIKNEEMELPLATVQQVEQPAVMISVDTMLTITIVKAITLGKLLHLVFLPSNLLGLYDHHQFQHLKMNRMIPRNYIHLYGSLASFEGPL